MLLRGWLPVFVFVAIAMFAGCKDSEDSIWSAEAIAQSGADVPFSVIRATSPPSVGLNRLAIALTDRGALLSDASVVMRTYWFDDQPEKVSQIVEAHAEVIANPRSLTTTFDHHHDDGTIHLHEGPKSTVYVAHLDLHEPGWWGIEADVELNGKRYEGIRFTFWVLEESSEPAIGAVVPRSKQRTLRDVTDISEIDSAIPPNRAFHERTIAEALDTGKPVVVAFVTPAFCQTRFCGPVMESVILPIYERYGTTVEIVHIEPFDLAAARQGELISVPTAEEWGLLAEPFVFVLKPDGTVAAKFQGIMESEEIVTVLDELLSS